MSLGAGNQDIEEMRMGTFTMEPLFAAVPDRAGELPLEGWVPTVQGIAGWLQAGLGSAMSPGLKCCKSGVKRHIRLQLQKPPLGF